MKTKTEDETKVAEAADAKEAAHAAAVGINSPNRLASYKNAATETEHRLTGAHLFGLAQTILALVKADTTKERQVIADAALDGIDHLVLTAANTTEGNVNFDVGNNLSSGSKAAK